MRDLESYDVTRSGKFYNSLISFVGGGGGMRLWQVARSGKTLDLLALFSLSWLGCMAEADTTTNCIFVPDWWRFSQITILATYFYNFGNWILNALWMRKIIKKNTFKPLKENTISKFYNYRWTTQFSVLWFNYCTY